MAASIPVLRALVHEGTTQRHDRSLEKISGPRLSDPPVLAASPSRSEKETSPSSLEAGPSGTNSDNDLFAHAGNHDTPGRTTLAR